MIEECKKLVEDNHNLIFFVINKMGLSLNSIEDWYGVAAIGLCKAAITYDESKGFTFSTYATRCMTNMILMSFRTNKKLVNDYLSLDEHINNDGDIKLQDTLIDPNNIGPEYILNYIIFFKLHIIN